MDYQKKTKITYLTNTDAERKGFPTVIAAIKYLPILQFPNIVCLCMIILFYFLHKKKKKSRSGYTNLFGLV